MAVHPSLSHLLKLFEYLRSSCLMLDSIQIAEPSVLYMVSNQERDYCLTLHIKFLQFSEDALATHLHPHSAD